MKYRFFLLFFAICFFVNVSAQKNELTYPEDSVSVASRKAFDKTFKQGQVLYMISCGSCHNFKDKNKVIVPDFSMPQLMDYAMRIEYLSHREKLDDKHITDEEMTKIILYLRFKKKSGREFPVRNP